MKISFIDKNKYYSKEDEIEKNHHPKFSGNSSTSNINNLDKKTESTLEAKTLIKKQEEILKKENGVVEENKNLNSYVLSKDNIINNIASLKSLYNFVYDIVFSILILLTSVGFFYIFKKSIEGEFSGFQTWIFPILAFSFFIIFLVIYSITAHTKLLLWIILTLTFLVSSFFAFYIFHILVIIIMTFWALLSARQMRKALVDSVTIHSRNLIRLGIGGIMFSVIVIMSSQYYWTKQSQGLADILLSFSKVKISEKVLDKYFQSTQKENSKKEIKSSQISVDEFILILVKDDEKDSNSAEVENKDSGIVEGFLDKVGINTDEFGQKIDNLKTTAGEKTDEVLVTATRKKLSKQLGQDLKGDENIAEVFDKVMYENIANYFAEKQEKEERRISYLALILTFLLFISFLTLKTILTPILIYLTVGVFFLLKKWGVIKVVKVNRETEMIILQSSV